MDSDPWIPFLAWCGIVPTDSAMWIVAFQIVLIFLWLYAFPAVVTRQRENANLHDFALLSLLTVHFFSGFF